MNILRRDRLNQLLKGIPPTSYGFDNLLSGNRCVYFLRVGRIKSEDIVHSIFT
ncbi:hypothetical protein QUA56_23250 [Microcoleus sp. N3A4]|uniref:hypothetical protein n=1 Tax=Microcoleus sp. N3A4 TaxID=3055379 RepID=UPI002FD48EF3